MAECGEQRKYVPKRFYFPVNRGGTHLPQMEESGRCFHRADTWARPYGETAKWCKVSDLYGMGPVYPPVTSQSTRHFLLRDAARR